MATDTHTPAELTRLAEALGIGREEFPEFYDQMPYVTPNKGKWWPCNLPSPLSDSPRACMWDGFILRALGSSVGTFETPVGSYGVNNARGGDYYGATLTAALFRAFEAARPDWRVG